MILFYDGTCGLCHGFVRLVLRWERGGAVQSDGEMLFAPIGGETWKKKIPAEVAAALPDSIVCLTGDGRIFVKSQAVLLVAKNFVGFFRILASVAGMLPKRMLDFFYDWVAKVRKKIFKTPEGVCPVVPEELRRRFLG